MRSFFFFFGGGGGGGCGVGGGHGSVVNRREKLFWMKQIYHELAYRLGKLWGMYFCCCDFLPCTQRSQQSVTLASLPIIPRVGIGECCFERYWVLLGNQVQTCLVRV